MSGSDSLPGFAGLLQLGYSRDEAWKLIRDSIRAEPGALEILAVLAATPEGRESLECAGAHWAKYGLQPPWTGLLGDAQ